MSGSNFELKAFGHAIEVSSDHTPLLDVLNDTFRGYVSGPAALERRTRVHVEACADADEYEHVLAQRRASAYGAWPLKKCVGEILFDGGPDKRVVALNPDADMLAREVEWLATRIYYQHLPGEVVALHSSSVCDREGRGIVFLGPSGAGKSTMAAVFVSRGFQLVTEETTYVTLGRPCTIAGLPTPLGLEPDNLALFERILGARATLLRGRLDPFVFPGCAFTETRADFRLLVLPSLSPLRPATIIADVRRSEAERPLLRRWIPEGVYHPDRPVPDDWLAQVTDGLPVARVDGRVNSTEIVDELLEIATV